MLYKYFIFTVTNVINFIFSVIGDIYNGLCKPIKSVVSAIFRNRKPSISISYTFHVQKVALRNKPNEI